MFDVNKIVIILNSEELATKEPIGRAEDTLATSSASVTTVSMVELLSLDEVSNEAPGSKDEEMAVHGDLLPQTGYILVGSIESSILSRKTFST